MQNTHPVDRLADLRSQATLTESSRCIGKPMPAAALTRKGFPTQWQTIPASPHVQKQTGGKKCRSLAETRPESDIRRPSEPGEDDEREHRAKHRSQGHQWPHQRQVR